MDGWLYQASLWWGGCMLKDIHKCVALLSVRQGLTFGVLSLAVEAWEGTPVRRPVT